MVVPLIYVLIDGSSNLLSKGAFVSLVGEYIIQIIAEENNGEARPPSRKLENMHPRIRITKDYPFFSCCCIHKLSFSLSCAWVIISIR